MKQTNKVTSLELSKELYELSRWGDTGLWDECYRNNNGKMAHKQVGSMSWETSEYTPLYDLGYLIRKLPNWTTINKWGEHSDSKYEATCDPMDSWTSEDLKEYADTPEDACAKLAIQLFKQGILKKEEL